MSRKIIIIEEDDEDIKVPVRRFPNNHDWWICPYCGKKVYSMEVHPCNQPFLTTEFK